MNKFDFDSMKEILCCPKCHSALVLHDSALLCTSGECRLQFAITDEIPVMLIDSATELTADAWGKAQQTQTK